MPIASTESEMIELTIISTSRAIVGGSSLEESDFIVPIIVKRRMKTVIASSRVTIFAIVIQLFTDCAITTM